MEFNNINTKKELPEYMNNIKYLILDFGNVLVAPTTGSWDMTPKFLELIDINKLDIERMNKIRSKYGYILSEKIVNLEEEYDMFLRFYDSILSECNYPGYNKKIAEVVAYDRTYNYDKYRLYDGVLKELTALKTKYTLILLSDNWPCAIPYMKEFGLYDLFDKIYISSFYGVEKKDKVFFDYPIRDFNIKTGEGLFIDDNESLLEIAKEKGLNVMLMDRENNISNSKYKKIKSLRKIII
mgnify:CR=1 FL=1